MTTSLGILVCTEKYLVHVIRLADAAHARGHPVEIFFTGAGVRLTQKADFRKLVGKARLSVCDSSFRANGFFGSVPGIGINDFVTHSRNAEMIRNCDRYVVF